MLPGLDMTMDEAAWNAIGGGTDEGFASSPAGGHPQAALRKLLSVMEISRADVTEIGMARACRGAARSFYERRSGLPRTTDACLRGASRRATKPLRKRCRRST